MEKNKGSKGVRGHSNWCGGGGKGLGGGLAQGEGTLECRTLGGVIPRQGGGKRSWRSGPDKEGGPLLKYASWL
jgi:hypothetical protein